MTERFNRRSMMLGLFGAAIVLGGCATDGNSHPHRRDGHYDRDRRREEEYRRAREREAERRREEAERRRRGYRHEDHRDRDDRRDRDDDRRDHRSRHDSHRDPRRFEDECSLRVRGRRLTPREEAIERDCRDRALRRELDKEG